MSVVEQTLREDPRRLRRDGFRHPRPLPPRRSRRSRKRSPLVRRRGGARGDRACAQARDDARARRLLPDRRGPAAARARGAGARFRLRRRCAGRAARMPLALYLGAIALTTGILTAALLLARMPTARAEWMLVLVGLVAAARDQPAGGRAGELARDVAGGAAAAAADGFLRRHSAGSAHAGRGADACSTSAAAHRATWSRRSKCASSPIATSTCTSRCSPISAMRTQRDAAGGRGAAALAPRRASKR